MTGNIGGSSDIDFARHLSRRLAGSTAPAESPPDPGYVHFDTADSSSPAPPVSVQPPDNLETWDQFLRFCAEYSSAGAAFAVDPQGFVIGSCGRVPEDGFEGTGAELSHVMRQAEDMNPEMGQLLTVALSFANRKVAGRRLDTGDAKGFVLAFIDAEALSDAVWQVILTQLERSVHQLR